MNGKKMQGKKKSSREEVRIDHFFAPHFLPFLNFGSGSRPRQGVCA